MQRTFAIGAAVFARAGDVVWIFTVGAPRSGGLLGKLSSGGAAARSPLLFNETSHAWFMTDAHAIGGGSRVNGSTIAYDQAPDPGLAVHHITRGTVLRTAQVHEMGYHGIDTAVTIEVIEERAVAAGEPWQPQWS